MQTILAFAVWASVVTQLPQEVPRDSYGWPMPAFKAAYVAHHVGMEPLALYWAENLWDSRDPETGLWVNSFGYVDFANPFHATLLYESIGQHERAVEISQTAISLARETPGYYYNPKWFTALTAWVVGDEPPLDLLSVAGVGLGGSYRPGEPVSDKGQAYADRMGKWWEWFAGGPPAAVRGSKWCAEKAGEECLLFYKAVRGEWWLPILREPYGFFNDDVLWLSIDHRVGTEGRGRAGVR